MGLKGQTHNLMMDSGGFQFPQNIDVADEHAMLSPSRNIIFVFGGRQKRRGTTNPVDALDGGLLQGLLPYTKLSGTEYLIGVTDLGNVYDLLTATGLGTLTATSNAVSGLVFQDTAYITSSEATPKKSTGGAFAALTLIPTDWGSVGPKQWIVRRSGNANRIVAIGVPGHENEVYFSKANSDDMSDAEVIVLDVEVGEAGGLIGIVEFGGRLVAVSKTKAFLIDDSSTTTANWSWAQAQWTGGAATWRLVVKTQNDLFAMMGDGDVYSIVTAQEYGDYKAASVSRPAWIHRWVDENIDLTRLDEAHAVYDPGLRCVYWFLPRLGSSYVDMALVYFVDRPPAEAWVMHDNLARDSGFRATCSAYGPAPVESFSAVLTGGPLGRIWYLDSQQDVLSDDAGAYEAGFITAFLHQGNPRARKRYKYGHILSTVEGDFDLLVDIYVDGIFKRTVTVTLGSGSSVYGSAQYGPTAFYGGDEYLIADFPIGYIGTRLQYRVYNNQAGENFFVSRILTDFKELGLRPSSTIANR